MKKKHQGSRCVVWMAVFLATFVFASSAMAQPQPAPTPIDASAFSVDAFQTTDASGRQTGWSITVVFDQNFDTKLDGNDLGTSHYRLIDVANGSFVLISQANFIVRPNATISRIRLVVPSADAMDKDGIYHLYAFNMTFGGRPATDPSKLQQAVKMRPRTDKQGKIVTDKNGKPLVAIDDTNTQEISAHSPPKAAWGLKQSKGRDDSDLYGSYELVHARGAATTGTGDFKLKMPFFKTFWHRTSRFSPVVDFKASSDADADPDSLKFAGEWFFPVHVPNDPDSHNPYRTIDWINSGKIEAPKNFNNINALWENKWLFPSSHFPWNSKKFRMFLDPFAGTELGKNLRSPLKSIEGKGLARLMVGADLTIQIKVKNLAALKGFEFDSSYIRRWPLKRELLVDKDDKGNLVALALSKGPKDYSDSKFIIKINDYFGPYIGYEWGRLPPNYELVDHKWTFGLLFKAKVRASGE